MKGHQKPALILVVEDEAALRQDIIEELEEAGYRTEAAPDGQQALERLAEATPDLVLCDITMPGLDGYGLLAALREDRSDLAATPFVFLTALSEPREVIEGKLKGADDYLVKPVDYDLMLATVAARLRQVERLRHFHAAEIGTLRGALAGLSGGGAERALDLIALGIVLLDRQGRTIHANRAALGMAASGIWRIGAGGVRAADTLSEPVLQRAISDTLAAAEAGQEQVTGLQLRHAEDAGHMTVLACALPQGAAAPATDPAADHSDRPRLALFLSMPDRRQRVPEPLLMDLFGLTPTEARVAAALAGSTRPVDVATELGVSQTTIAFHMRNLFQKTGTNRQADLIALILAGPMMINATGCER